MTTDSIVLINIKVSSMNITRNECSIDVQYRWFLQNSVIYFNNQATLT